jgi:hypothetical protein
MFNITSVTTKFTDKAKAQVDSLTNSTQGIKRDARTKLTVRADHTIAGLAENQYIGLVMLREGADICWHEAQVLTNTAADDFVCELGIIDEDGIYTPKATMGTAVNFVSNAVIPEPAELILTKPTWVVAKVLEPAGAAVIPQTGKLSFYLSYIAVA